MASNKKGLIYSKRTIAVFRTMDNYIAFYQQAKGIAPPAIAVSTEQAAALPKHVFKNGYKGIPVQRYRG